MATIEIRRAAPRGFAWGESPGFEWVLMSRGRALCSSETAYCRRGDCVRAAERARKAFVAAKMNTPATKGRTYSAKIFGK